MVRLLKILFTALLLPAIISCSDNKFDADVMVIGGGTAGTIAAIQSARAGASTILVESGSMLGGTSTVGGVSLPGLFHAWGRQVISGIGWDLVCKAVSFDGGTMPDFSIPFGTDHPKHQIHINPYVYSMLAEEACIKAGVQLRYYEFPLAVRQKKNGWEVDLAGKGTRLTLRCKQLVDCTGNAAVVALAGLTRLREEEIQPGSLIFSFRGYDPQSLDYESIENALQKAREDGTLEATDCYTSARTLLDPHTALAVSHVIGADSSDSERHTEANIAGRSSLMRLMRFLKTLPGLENLTVATMQPETAIRETYRIDGLYQVSLDDYVSGKVFDDAVGYSYYPIDLHNASGVDPAHLKDGAVATIPYRALIPKGSRNLIVAGRCISSDRMANSALRVQASCMAMGQAAGAAAALCSQLGLTPEELPIDTLQKLIRKNGGIIPEK